MKKILMILLIFLFSITAACNKNNKIDISNLNEDMLKIEYCELKSNGFIGVIYQNYLCYGPNTYIPTITIPTKAEFENGEYVNETYKLEYNDCIYIVKNNHLQINNETNQFQFNYEKNE